MSNKRVVEFSIEAKATLMGQVEITEEEYAEWCAKIDEAKGWEKEDVASELALMAGVIWEDADISDDEVSEFNWK